MARFMVDFRAVLGRMAELADALALGASRSNPVRVRVPLRPPLVRRTHGLGKRSFPHTCP